jgi:hypothetical protein
MFTFVILYVSKENDIVVKSCLPRRHLFDQKHLLKLSYNKSKKHFSATYPDKTYLLPKTSVAIALFLRSGSVARNLTTKLGATKLLTQTQGQYP